MLLVVLTPVRLIGEGIAAMVRTCLPDAEIAVARNLPALRAMAAASQPLRLAIVVMSDTVALDAVRQFRVDFPLIPLLALGMSEHSEAILAHARAGFTGWLNLDDGPDVLNTKLCNALDGRFLCSGEVGAVILHGLFDQAGRRMADDDSGLTVREDDVAALMRRGLSNKEIARDLGLSESTVKTHVHHILAKTGAATRVHYMRMTSHARWEGVERSA